MPSILRGRSNTDLLQDVSVAGAATIWILDLTTSTGGLHNRHTAVFALALLLPLGVLQAWRHVPRVLLALVGMTSAGAATVLLTSDVGALQADSPAAQLVGLLALVVTTVYARTPARRRAVVGVLVAAAALQFFQAWFPWWGSGSPDTLLVGTFYWHNQVAAYLGALALVAGASAVFGGGALQRWSIVVAPVGAAGVVLSTGRSALALLVLGLITLGLLAVTRPRRLLPALLLPVLTAGVVLGLTSGVFFAGDDYSGPPVTSTPNAPAPIAGSRGSDSFASNGSDRLRWSAAALRGFADAPLTGHGFGSFAATSAPLLPVGATRSAFVHNGYAEALTSGGLLFGGPLLALCGLLAVRALQGVRAGGPERGVLVGCSLATLFLLGHSLVDFDWHYPSLVVLLGVTGGVVLSTRPPRRTVRPAVAVTVLLLTVAVVVGGSLAEHEYRSGVQAAATS